MDTTQDPPQPLTWEEGLAALRAARQKQAPPQESRSGPESDTALWDWCQEQRLRHWSGKLSQEHRRLLDSAGFEWEVPRDSEGRRRSPLGEARWEQQFHALRAFHQQHGHWRVPNSREKGSALLYAWVQRLRLQITGGMLPPDRLARLEAVGFPVDREGDGVFWKLFYQELEQFHRDHGHTQVPSDVKELRALHLWCHQQRVRKRLSCLPPQRERLLAALGFEFAPGKPARVDSGRRNMTAWRRHSAEFAAFRERYGHGLVPTQWHVNPALGAWVGARRHEYKMGHLPPQLAAELEALGFVWDSRAEMRRLAAEDPALLQKALALRENTQG